MSFVNYDANDQEYRCGNCRYWRLNVKSEHQGPDRDRGRCVFNPVPDQCDTYRDDTCGKFRQSKAHKEAKAEERKQKRSKRVTIRPSFDKGELPS